MLAQLVCVDRRYQRMNCFNIREIQSLLKRRFFVDLINTQDHRTLLHKTMVNLKYKTYNLNEADPNLFIFYNYGLELSPKTRNQLFMIENLNSETKTNPINNYLLELISDYSIFNHVNRFYFYIIEYLNPTIFYTTFKELTSYAQFLFYDTRTFFVNLYTSVATTFVNLQNFKISNLNNHISLSINNVLIEFFNNKFYITKPFFFELLQNPVQVVSSL